MTDTIYLVAYCRVRVADPLQVRPWTPAQGPPRVYWLMRWPVRQGYGNDYSGYLRKALVFQDQASAAQVARKEGGAKGGVVVVAICRADYEERVRREKGVA